MPKINFLFLVSVALISLNSLSLPFPLTGIWNTKCIKESELFHLVSIEIHEDIWIKTDWWASDKYCENIVLEKQLMYQFQISDNKWNGKSLMSYLRPYVQGMADQFNAKSLCGVTRWKHGRVIEVTGKSCSGFEVPGYDQMLYSAIKLEGPKNNLMWLGAGDSAHSGESESTRHVLYSDQILVRDPTSL